MEVAALGWAWRNEGAGLADGRGRVQYEVLECDLHGSVPGGGTRDARGPGFSTLSSRAGSQWRPFQRCRWRDTGTMY